MTPDVSASLKPGPDDDNWNAWHPAELGRRLAGISQPWCIVGSWALDLWHGHRTRDHEDLEFTILRSDFSLFRRALLGLQFHTAGDGIVRFLPEDREPPDDIFQIWCRDIASQCWRVDMMIEPGTPSVWAYKREPGITRRRADMVAVTPDGLPYLKPAGVLLFKAKHRRPKDETDFTNALPRLPPAERLWLKTCLQELHPDHDWIGLL